MHLTRAIRKMDANLGVSYRGNLTQGLDYTKFGGTKGLSSH